MALSFELNFGHTRGEGRRPDRQPAKILLLVSDQVAGNAGRLARIDVDNFDAVAATMLPRIAPRIEVAGRRLEVTLNPQTLEALEPEALADTVGIVRELRELAKQVRSGADPAAALRRLTSMLEGPAAESAGTAAPAPPLAAAAPEPGDDFARLLGDDAAGTSPERRSATAATGRVASFIETILAEDAASIRSDDHAAVSSLAEQAVNALIRQILADPQLRDVERTWRGIRSLVTTLDPESVQLWLLPVDFATLSAQPQTAVDALAGIIEAAGRGADAAGFRVLGVDYDTRSADDVRMLAGLAPLAVRLNSLLLCAAPDRLAESDPPLPRPDTEPPINRAELGGAWAEFRKSAGAGRSAAALPRLLLRLPYGRRGESTYLPGFEELDGRPPHEAFLWGNPVYGLLLLAAAALGDEDADGRVDLLLEDMPMAVYDDGSGDAIMPPSEIYLSEQSVAVFASLGVLVFQSFRNRNAVVLSGWHSIAD